MTDLTPTIKAIELPEGAERITVSHLYPEIHWYRKYDKVRHTVYLDSISELLGVIKGGVIPDELIVNLGEDYVDAITEVCISKLDYKNKTIVIIKVNK